MEKLEKIEHGENDHFHLSQVIENNKAEELLGLLISISTISDLSGFFSTVVTALKDIVDFETADLLLGRASAGNSHLTYRHGKMSKHQDEGEISLLQQQNDEIAGFAFRTPKQFHRSRWTSMLQKDSRLFQREMEFEYSYYIPFWNYSILVGFLAFRTNKKGGFGPRTIAVLHVAAKIIAPRFYQLTQQDQSPLKICPTLLPTKNQLKPDKHMPSPVYGKMIGISDSMRHVFDQVAEVAQADASVLILGETGTGKELIARALHENSPRKNKPMVKVNCAALPAEIIESELFGHEKGSFTGATDRRIGKFEQANNGTIFLDEIGELPLVLQTKLLRVLQEREIERIGGMDLIKVNVRIVAATNRDLLQEVHKGNFRSDLYFRLNVFPISIPPLRDRKEDIPFLAMHLLHKHTKGPKHPPGFSSNAMKQLQAYGWPGNVRELENVMQRCALFPDNEIINELPMQLLRSEYRMPGDARIKTIDQVEREHIIAVLKKCRGKVSGLGGAAEELNIPSSTLNSKMRRLKIKFAFMKKG
ncbi:sigma-54 dependent transcriptional regulator [Flavitalea sp. BT771]|uniref:sigma-54 interaction domain-containing protein n=1 Tax=Flavitalea sp. BT771 TaxID=3063329 RepID=UPI0026E27B3E|nr:sigma-54 dependent transcriptional regulator [Flavitalea sp. BT771]MDO6430231.1 sigma-54 dependent transcriptional regulator [Flavitalea sp. BT771]MDV6219629.1 sigma-54 dependent transcriptional regulator [Flavitalea sp. BT771]